ncbi:MAG TPA: tetratricopeptide repeat protein [Spirochaetota bacterium]|nr:tetratricopeptide repeat protein [Spirochaetota bacterium]HPC39390.1 tetratricopeptide repeat protein [Spirochaetota bacterium]HPL16877.1 tetratricopeptide repeat protein [Spirochaetota bacterium]HQF06727.1 tetratricopeptide repeat protein [Spirochaetota bacterium]HQH95654.1 tetratricopeptide repeat protein [Spirochaetota bacterium]
MSYAILVFFILLIIVAVMILKSTSFPSKIRKAEEYLEEGQISKANEIIKKILEQKSEYAPARYLRAQILMKQNQYLLAISELNNILGLPEFNKHINEIEIHYHLARLYNETKNFPKEIEEYKSILIFNPEDLTANHRIGHALYKKKEYKKAREHLLKAIILDPNLTDVYLPLGIACYNISDYEKGEEYLTKALNVQGDHVEAQFHLGSIYHMKKDFKNAIAMFEKSKKDRRYFVKSLYKIGEIYHQSEEYDNAIEVLEQGLGSLTEKTEESLQYRYLLAECYEHQNKIKEAFHHWTKIVEENPNFRGTRVKIDSYQDILENESLMTMFISSLESLQPTIVEMISSLNYNIISKDRINPNEYQYRAYNIKRINDPPILIYFHRTTLEITEENMNDFQRRIIDEKCKNGMYITTSKFSIRAKALAQAKTIEIYDAEFLKRIVEKIQSRKKIK